MLSKIQEVVLAHIGVGLSQKRISLVVSEKEMSTLKAEVHNMDHVVGGFAIDNPDAPITVSLMGYTIYLSQV